MDENFNRALEGKLTRGDSGQSMVTMITATGPITWRREGNRQPQSPGTYRPATSNHGLAENVLRVGLGESQVIIAAKKIPMYANVW